MPNHKRNKYTKSEFSKETEQRWELWLRAFKTKNPALLSILSYMITSISLLLFVLFYIQPLLLGQEKERTIIYPINMNSPVSHSFSIWTTPKSKGISTKMFNLILFNCAVLVSNTVIVPKGPQGEFHKDIYIAGTARVSSTSVCPFGVMSSNGQSSHTHTHAHTHTYRSSR